MATHGGHLKASAAMVRLRLYDILALLPPKNYEGLCFEMKVSEFWTCTCIAPILKMSYRSLCVERGIAILLVVLNLVGGRPTDPHDIHMLVHRTFLN